MFEGMLGFAIWIGIYWLAKRKVDRGEWHWRPPSVPDRRPGVMPGSPPGTLPGERYPGEYLRGKRR